MAELALVARGARGVSMNLRFTHAALPLDPAVVALASPCPAAAPTVLLEQLSHCDPDQRPLEHRHLVELLVGIQQGGLRDQVEAQP